jgi:glycine cleavage system H protein
LVRPARGQIVHVKLPAAGDAVAAGEPYGGIEAGKTASDVCAPVSGEVVEVNSLLEDEPQKVSEDCYGRAGSSACASLTPRSSRSSEDADAYAAFLDEA